jgi:glycosyltransferase involved in cell wall biosynthesis
MGDGPEREPLEGLARQRGRRVLFLGSRAGADKQAWLHAADLLVAPSRVLADGRTDSAPVVLLEAMAAGLPLISSRVGGAAELIVDNENGLLVPPEEIAALRRAIVALAADPERRAALARAGRRTAADHGWHRVAGRLRSLLCAL